jgi:hypothetical protein
MKMNSLCHELFAGAAFALNQYRGISRRNLSNPPANLAIFFALPNEIRQAGIG